MGLDVSHDAWHGSYGAFMRFRIWLAKEIGISLETMEGFTLMGGLSWDRFADDPLVALLDHSDCDGRINVPQLIPLADRLEAIAKAPKDPGDDGAGRAGYFVMAARQFAKAAREAAAENEPLEFC